MAWCGVFEFGRTKSRRLFVAVVSGVVVVSLAWCGVAAASSPTLTTDQLDYAPDQTVHINGSGFDANTTYAIPVLRPNGSIVQGDGTFTPGWDTATSDGSGTLTYSYQLDGVQGTYEARAYPSTWTGDWTQPPVASVTFEDHVANLDQCTNGAVGPPIAAEPCQGSNAAAQNTFKNWENGNANGTKAHWAEGDFISYRVTMSSVAAGTHTLVMHYSPATSGKHAIDYLGSFDATETTSATAGPFHANRNDPCGDQVLAGSMSPAVCTPSSPVSSLSVPAADLVHADAAHCGTAGTFSGTQVPGAIKMFGPAGSALLGFTYLSQNVSAGSGCDTTVSLSFSIPSALSANDSVVIAWGGHIASELNWGAGNSASFINGSPYHMAMDTLDGQPQGSQDRGLDASATFQLADDLTVSKNATGSYDKTFRWGITKSVDSSRQQIAGGGSATFHYTVNVTHDAGSVRNVRVTGTVTVTNPNSDSVTINGVTDKLSDGTDCSVTGGGPQSLDPGDTTFSYSCHLPDAQPPSNLTNTSKVSWSDQTLAGGSTLAASTASFTTPPISFTENVIDGSVTVSDPSDPGSPHAVSSTDPSPTTFTYSRTVGGVPGTCTNYSNTATFTTNTTGTTSQSSQTVTLCVGRDLQVSKTSTPSFSRTYGWTITKSADKAMVEQIGGTATFRYTVRVDQTSATSGAWFATGSITLTNPNDWEAITANVTDAVDNGGVCTVTGGSGIVVPESSSVVLPYSCTYSSAPSPATGTNTGTATWNAGTFTTPTGSASGSAPVAFTMPTTTVNKTVTVTDSYAGALGTVTATDSLPFASATYTYSQTLPIPALFTNNCVHYVNVASIVQTGQMASSNVEVCGPARTNARKMGFWQGTAGQNIIKGGGSNGTVCKSGTWLRQYRPFANMSATATCAQVATYVANVVTAANALGASENAKLKAQMLATALNVYFSDPSLGGNYIGAPGRLGPYLIRLWYICDNTTLSPGCGGFEDTSTAFGAPSPTGSCLIWGSCMPSRRSVLQMLSYASSRSNIGGSLWYGQVSTTQERAKDAFDAINSQVAYAHCPM